MGEQSLFPSGFGGQDIFGSRLRSCSKIGFARSAKRKFLPPREFFFSNRFSTRVYKEIDPPPGPSQGAVVPLRPAQALHPGAHRAPEPSAHDRRNSFAEKLSNRECRSEGCRQHQIESAAPGGLATTPARRRRTKWTNSSAITLGLRCAARGETPKPRMPFGEVPIKHGSADGGLVRERAREIGP